MGLFDGTPSSADLARHFGVPVLAVIDGTAMAQTFGALALGLARYQADLPFAGVLANRVGSLRHAQLLEGSLTEGLRWYGGLSRRAGHRAAQPPPWAGAGQRAERPGCPPGSPQPRPLAPAATQPCHRR